MDGSRCLRWTPFCSHPEPTESNGDGTGTCLPQVVLTLVSHASDLILPVVLVFLQGESRSPIRILKRPTQPTAALDSGQDQNVRHPQNSDQVPTGSKPEHASQSRQVVKNAQVSLVRVDAFHYLEACRDHLSLLQRPRQHRESVQIKHSKANIPRSRVSSISEENSLAVPCGGPTLRALSAACIASAKEAQQAKTKHGVPRFDKRSQREPSITQQECVVSFGSFKCTISLDAEPLTALDSIPTSSTYVLNSEPPTSIVPQARAKKQPTKSKKKKVNNLPVDPQSHAPPGQSDELDSSASEAKKCKIVLKGDRIKSETSSSQAKKAKKHKAPLKVATSQAQPADTPTSPKPKSAAHKVPRQQSHATKQSSQPKKNKAKAPTYRPEERQSPSHTMTSSEQPDNTGPTSPKPKVHGTPQQQSDYAKGLRKVNHVYDTFEVELHLHLE